MSLQVQHTPVWSEVSLSTFIDALKKCSSSGDVETGKRVHRKAVVFGYSGHLHVVNSLISMYTRCSRMVEAQKVFDEALHRDVVTWTVLIQGYADHGENATAVELFECMEREPHACAPSSRTCVAVLCCCAALATESEETETWLEKGRFVHSRAVANSCCNMFVENTAVKMYARCKSMVHARQVFDGMTERNLVSWTAILQGYVYNEEFQIALELFHRMEQVPGSCSPDARIYVIALTACATLAGKDCTINWLEAGRRIYQRAGAAGCMTIYVENTAIDLYASSQDMLGARDVFDRMTDRDVVSFNTLMHGYVENGESKLALELFDILFNSRSASPNSRTFVIAFSACASLGAAEVTSSAKRRWLNKARDIHGRALRTEPCNVFLENTSVDVYAKCGSMVHSQVAFDCMVDRNMVSWNALVNGYVENGENELALELVSDMELRNTYTYLAAVTACGNLMRLETGEEFHREISACGLDQEVVLANCLVDFYGKCGKMNDARRVFESISKKTVVSWTSFMCGYARQGDTGSVFEVFERMREQGVAPNEATFVCVLTACSRAGLVERGREVFDAMQMTYGVRPSVEHYSCMVDVLCRANRVEEAVRMVKSMPFDADIVIWTIILEACRKRKNDTIARMAFEALLVMEDVNITG